MPYRVRLKLALWIIAGIAVLIFLASIAWPLALVYALAVLLFVEMIYPKWNFFGSAILDVKSAGPYKVAITFDDGPSLWTEKILDVLKEKKVKATFFLLGKNVERHPEIAKRIQNEGHAIGMHAYSHEKLHLKGPAFIKNDIDLCEEAFKKAGISHDHLFRFSHGFKNIFGVLELKRRNLKLCGWGRGVWDSRRPGVDHIVRHSLQLKDGEILLLHDANGVEENPDRSQTAEALPHIIDGLRARGFEFVRLGK